MTTDQNMVLRVRATMRLRATAEGGRATPVADKYMPNIRVNAVDGYAGFMIGNGATMTPGAEAEIELAMIGSPDFIKQLQVGQSFSVHEGSKQVGCGVVEVIIEGPMDRFES